VAVLRHSEPGTCGAGPSWLTYNQMVVDTLSDEETNRLFQALADATRRDILERSIAREQSVSSLATHYEMSFAAVQKHVAVLERAALVTKERRGREQIVRAHEPTILTARRLLQAFEQLWVQRANRMAEVMGEMKGVTT
jgi:DNA-binding transcriptional ArsR family regulator